MKTLKAIAITLVVVFTLLASGCGETNFSPNSMEMEQHASGVDVVVKASNDKKLTKNVWNLCTNVVIDETTEGEMGAEYIYVAFFSDKTKDYAVFTLYSNGSCCLGEEFDVFYEVKNGKEIYDELLEYYNECPEKE